MIGTGVFIRPASMVQDVGSVPLLLLAWLAGGLISLVLALCYAELATSMPEAGGEYIYLRAAFGELPAFMFGWMRFVVGAGISAALSVGVAVFLSDLLPLQGHWWQGQWHLGSHHGLAQWGPKDLMSLGVIGLLAAANCIRVSAAGTVQVAFAAIKVTALAALIAGAAAFVLHGSSRLTVADVAIPGGTLAGFPTAILTALFGYNGWVGVTMIAGEVRDTGRPLARSIAIGVGIVMALYLLLNLAFAGVLPLAEFANASSAAHPDAPSVGVKLARAVFGSPLAAMMSLIFALSAAGTLHAHLLTIPRIFYSMAQDGLFFPIFARVNPHSSVPRSAVVLFSLWVALLALIGGYDRLTSMAIFAIVLFYALNVVGLLVLRRRRPGRERPYRVPGYPLLPLIALAVVSWILFRVVMRGAPEALAALTLLLLGLPVYGLFRWRRRARA